MYHQLRLRNPAFFLSHDISFSPDGNYILASTEDKHFLWEVANGKLIKEFSCNSWDRSGSQFSSDSKYFALQGEESLSIYDLSNMKTKFQSKNGFIGGFSPGGNEFLYEITNPYYLCHIVNLKNNKQYTIQRNIEEIDLEKAYVKTLKKSVDGNWIAFVNYSDEEEKEKKLMVSLYDFKTKRNTRKLIAQWNEEIYFRWILTGGDKVFVFGKQKVGIFDLNRMKHHIIKFDEEIWGDPNNMKPLCVSFEGDYFAIIPKLNDRAAANIYSVKSCDIYKNVSFNQNRPVQYMAIDSKKDIMAVGFQKVSGEGLDGSIVLFDTSSGSKIVELKMK